LFRRSTERCRSIDGRAEIRPVCRRDPSARSREN
jgi:hypothetical protein